MDLEIIPDNNMHISINFIPMLKTEFMCFGDELCQIMINPKISDYDVFAYLKFHNFQILLKEKRMFFVLFATVTGRLHLLELLNSQQACLNETVPFFEYTPLHLSLMFGQIHCSVRLIQVRL